jgi:choloylglycine hydrolase
MKRFRNTMIAIATMLTLNVFHSASACTDFRLTAKDGTVMITRSMEFALDMKSNLRTSNRGRKFETLSSDNKPGMTWKAKYGYIFFDGMDVDSASDGMNEKGLSFEALYLPGLAAYQTVPEGKDAHALPYSRIGDWILSSFDSVDQVREALKNTYVFTAKTPGLGDTIFPLHFAVFEASGKGIIIEYIGGKLSVYDNQIGVFTNSPSYDWHLTNLNNYVHLKPENPAPVMDSGVTFAATGQGFGMIGLPGDISPPSRFVKMATLLRVVYPVNNAAETLNLAEHLINNVDIPKGLAREPVKGDYTNETTQWVVFKDLTHKVIYYRTYGDLTLRSVSLDKIDFAENAPRLKMPIASGQYIQDLTSQFLNSKQAN